MRTAGWIILVAIVLVVVVTLLLRRPAPLPRMHYEPIAPLAPAVMAPMSLPDEQRWRDIADAGYNGRFIEAFTYEEDGAEAIATEPPGAGQVFADETGGAEQTPDEGRHAAPQSADGADGAEVLPRGGRVTAQLRGGPHLQAMLVAHGLKPNFAYQVKLLGTVPLRGASEADQGDDRAARSSYRLGRLGRWWCEQCGWNVADAELAEHVGAGHQVTGYVLADWLVTDARGDARHSFALDSSYHVLWRDDQRRRRRFDTRPRSHELHREAYAYPPEQAGRSERVRIFAEWEAGRPLPGRVQLPPGEYEVALNLTEESFHANLSERDEYGGFWARVLQTRLRFRVSEAGQR